MSDFTSGSAHPPGGHSMASTPTLRTMDAVRRIIRALRAATHGSEAELGVSAAQLFVLRELLARPGQSLGELAQGTRTSQSSVSEVVTRLVGRGLVSRQACAVDRRRVELTLTDEGRVVAGRSGLTVQERLIAGLEGLDDAQRRALADAMDAWLSAAGLSDVPPTMFFEP